MTPGVDREALRRDLDEAARRGTATLRARRWRRDLPRAVERAAPWLLLVPAVQLLVLLSGWTQGVPVGRLPLPALLVATLGVGVLALLGPLAARARRPVRRPAALAVLDERLGARGRLLAADDFLRRPAASRSAFMEAAIDDATDAARRAAVLPPEAAARGTRPRPRAAVLAAGALALLVLGLLVPIAPEGAAPERARAPGAPPLAPEAGRDAVPRAPVPPPAPTPGRPGRPEATPAGTDPGRALPPGADLPEAAKATEGRTASGPGAGARSTSGANDARGVPTNQGPAEPSDATPRPRPPARRPPAREAQPAPEVPPRETTEASGTTAGRGAARGSSRNPVASDWSSRDEVASEDDDARDDEEVVEDEESDSEARGGVQPSLRDRKPPTSRDLSIGFGNQPNPDAEGRGGPSQPKKSRGTASLVLGVPVPDRVRGQRNPGRTKVTQERVEPRPEAWDPVPAASRHARDVPAGPLASPDAARWMRRVVRAYFLMRPSPESERRP